MIVPLVAPGVDAMAGVRPAFAGRIGREAC